MTDALVIDAAGLDRLSGNAKADPATGKKTFKARTVLWPATPTTRP